MERREECCCFTGHRYNKLINIKNKVVKRLDIEVDIAFQEGKRVFISGMASGFDVWAAHTVIDKKKIYDIQLVCAMPYPEFCVNRQDYNECKLIMDNADMVKNISGHYYKSVFQTRNEWMVDCSSRVIAAYDGSSGGTRNTVNYAKKQSVPIINVLNPITLCLDDFAW